MIVAVFPLVAVLVGALMWGFTNGKASEAGRMIFFCGVLAFLLSVGSKTVHIG